MVKRVKLLSIIIPAYNEEKRLLNSLITVSNYLKKSNLLYEIIVVDDGNTDNTAGIIQGFREKSDKNIYLIKNGKNRGKGFSVKNGFSHAKGRYLLFSDADLSTPIDEVQKLLIYLNNGFDIAIGSRALKESDIRIHQPWYRESMGKFFNLMVRALVVRGFKDTQCGFKCFTRESALEICKRQRIKGFSFDVEMLYIARKLGYKVIEVPVQWLNYPDSNVHVIKDSTKMFIDLIRIRVNGLIGRYR